MLIELPTLVVPIYVNPDSVEYIRYNGGGESLLILSHMQSSDDGLIIPLMPEEVAAKFASVKKNKKELKKVKPLKRAKRTKKQNPPSSVLGPDWQDARAYTADLLKGGNN